MLSASWVATRLSTRTIWVAARGNLGRSVKFLHSHSLILSGPGPTEHNNTIRHFHDNESISYPPAPLIDDLSTLVRAGNFAAAQKLLTQLTDCGRTPPSDRVYEVVVEAILVGKPPFNTDVDDRVASLASWSPLLPQAADENALFLPFACERLFASPNASIPLLVELGVACASKGYVVMVNREITPIVLKCADQATQDRYLHAIHTHIPPSSVFESDTDDYVQVTSHAREDPVLPLTLIASHLPPVLPEPIRSDGPIFEDASSFGYESISFPHSYSPSSLGDMLTDLVVRGQYEMGLHILREAEDLHLTVPCNPLYEMAAQAFIDPKAPFSSKDPQEVVERFSAWFSLIPPIHHPDSPQDFPETTRLIFNAPLTNPLLIIRYALILASKGYARTVISRAVPLIMRFTTPEVGLKFLRDFNEGSSNYWRESQPENADYLVTITMTDSYSAAARALAVSNRFEEAITLLPTLSHSKYEYHLTSFTYDVLLQKLRQASSSRYAEAINRILALKGLLVSSPKDTSFEEDSLNSLAELQNISVEFGTKGPEELGNNLSVSLRYLKQSMTSRTPPHPSTLLAFMEGYAMTGRTTALALLQRRAHRTNKKMASVFAFAEMHYYHRRREPLLVVQTFVDNFYMSGVPRDEVLNLYMRGERLRETAEDAIPIRFPGFAIPSRGKLWPSSGHCTLVWHALLASEHTFPGVQRLYHKLVEIATKGKSGEDHNGVGYPQPLLPPPSWKYNIGPAAFTPFMRRLMLSHGVRQGTVLLGDMLKLGLQPTTHHFTELAGFYARVGEVKRALLILKRMEADHSKPDVPSTVIDSAPAGGHPQAPLGSEASSPGTASPSSTHHQQPSHQSIGVSLPKPDLVMYISILRGFLISKRLSDAAKLKERILDRYDYTVGVDRYLDAVFSDLEEMTKAEQKSLL